MRAPGSISRARVVTAFAALVAFAAAVGPPLDGWAEHDLAAHMLQHVALLSVVPPLLLLGRIPRLVALAAPASVRRRFRYSVAMDRPGVVVGASAAAVVLQTLALGLWHVPALYDAAAGNDAMHAAEHATFLTAGCLFWWTLLRLSAQLGPPAAVLALFAASLPATLFGALMTLSTTPWYPRYTTSTVAHAVARQQLAGVVMWAFGGMVTVVCAVALFGAWLATMERSAPLGLRPAP